MAEAKGDGSDVPPDQKYEFDRELADTLQGRIYLGHNKFTGKRVVLKEAWKHLVRNGKSRSGHPVPEDFIRERDLMKKIKEINKKKKPNHVVQLIDYWEDEQCYYIAMEFCHIGLFDYISGSHNKKLKKYVIDESKRKQEPLPNENPTPWILKIQFLFTQLVLGVNDLHANNICHLDLSLENSMIQMYTIKAKHDFNVKDEYNISKIIDFGLAVEFKDLNKIKSNTKRVGKVGYMAPEVFAKENYDARSADIYCLGVMLFMMLCGAPPYTKPTLKDPAFKYIIKGRLKDVLSHWKRLRLVTVDALDLIDKCIKFEKDRIKMDKLLKHPFITKGKKMLRYIKSKQKPSFKKIKKNNSNNNNNNDNDIFNDDFFNSKKAKKRTSASDFFGFANDAPKKNKTSLKQKLKNGYQSMKSSNNIFAKYNKNNKTNTNMNNNNHNNGNDLSDLFDFTSSNDNNNNNGYNERCIHKKKDKK